MLTPGTLASFETEIREAIGASRYELWFQGNTKLSLENGTLEIGVPNRFYREWLESHFQEEIRASLRKVFGSALPIRFRIDPALFRRSHTQQPDDKPEKKRAPSVPQRQVNGSVEPYRPPSPLKLTRFSLSRFVVGSPNQVAHAAVTSIVEDPANSYSPLVIHGGIGLGKTHLLKGIEEALHHRHRGLKAISLSCEEFANQFIEAMRSGKLNSFRRKFRQLDVLVVDDVQFLSNKRATQEEFFHTLNALEARSAKVVLACDVHPRKLTKMSEELKSRFVAGMVAKIDPPNREMRRQILRDKAARRGLELPPEVMEFLAENLRSNVSELEGAVNYLEHYRETMSASLDLPTVRTAMADILRHSVPVLSLSELQKKACDLFGLSVKSLRDRSRSRAVAHPRMLVLYLARKYTRATFSEIGQQIGGLNHSTVIAAEKKILSTLSQDGEIVLGERPWKVRDAIEAFERELGRG